VAIERVVLDFDEIDGVDRIDEQSLELYVQWHCFGMTPSSACKEPVVRPRRSHRPPDTGL
jgi:hypothetical protein